MGSINEKAPALTHGKTELPGVFNKWEFCRLFFCVSNIKFPVKEKCISGSLLNNFIATLLKEIVTFRTTAMFLLMASSLFC